MISDEMIKKYEDVFYDIVESRIEAYNDDLEENQEAKTLTDEEVRKIANDLIYKNEYIWEAINDAIDSMVNWTIERRGDE